MRYPGGTYSDACDFFEIDTMRRRSLASEAAHTQLNLEQIGYHARGSRNRGAQADGVEAKIQNTSEAIEGTGSALGKVAASLTVGEQDILNDILDSEDESAWETSWCAPKF